MKKLVFGAAAVAALATVLGSGSAQAQCWWNGYATSCVAPQGYYQPYGPTYGYGYPYGWTSDGSPYSGNKPAWLPSYPGPRASGRAGQ